MFSVPNITNALIELEHVCDAGAAPTDLGNVPCWRVEVELSHLTTEMEERICETIINHAPDQTVQTAKDTTDADTGVIWAVVYKPLETEVIGGITYDIIAASESRAIGIVQGRGHPTDSIEHLHWGQLDSDFHEYLN